MKAAVLGVKTNNSLRLYKKIKKLLEDQGVKVDFSYFKNSIDEEHNNLPDTYSTNQKLIKNSDFIVADITEYSSGVGYLIANALHEKKQALVLFNKSNGEVFTNIIKSSAVKTKGLHYVEYKKEEELDNIVKKYVQVVKQKLDTKFILIISPEIDKYLEWASDNRRMHKAQIVRDAVEEQMKKDKEWKKSQEA
jgi:uncharacterized protein (DUF1786 family)